MSEKKAKDCKVAIGTNRINGMGTFSYGGVTYDEVEKTQLGDSKHEWTETLFDGTDFSFDGWLDPDDTDGQEALRTANESATHMANLRFYIDSTSYYEPDQTGVSGASYARINSFQINGEKAGLINITFSGKCYGRWALV